MKMQRKRLLATSAGILLGTAPLVDAEPVASVMLRAYEVFGDQELITSIRGIDAVPGRAVAVVALYGDDDYDTAILSWDGIDWNLRYREGVTTVSGHGIVGDDFTVRLGEIDGGIGLGENFDVAYGAALRVECADPDNDPACQSDGAVAVLRNSDYVFGGVDDSFLCGAQIYDAVHSTTIDHVGYVYSCFDSGDTSLPARADDVAGPLICPGDSVAETDGFWSRWYNEMGVLKSTGSWYGVGLITGVPSNRDMILIADREALLQESDVVHFWNDPGAQATLYQVFGAALISGREFFWNGRLHHDSDIDYQNDEVVGFCSEVIIQNGDAVEGVPGALSATMSRLYGRMGADENCNVLWNVECLATFPGDDWPQDPDDMYERTIDLVMYNGEIILATGSPIDANGDGVIDAGDQGATYESYARDITFDGAGNIWFVGGANLAVGERVCLFRLSNLPDTPNPWCYPCPGDIDGDKKTTQSDLGLLLASYELPPDDPFFDPRADLDDDGAVGQEDLGLLLADYECGL
jgi:hypothetical protein